jgi:phosphatidylglycerol:prolipoprotein diacylglycerol transferase
VIPLPHSASEWIYVGAYAVGIAAFAAMAWRRRLATEGMRDIALAGLLGGLLGAHLFQWLGTRGAYPLGAAKSVLGGVAGGWLAVEIAKRWLGIRRSTGDLFAVALMAGEAVGRWGCHTGGCCYGRTWSGPWAVFQHDALRHPAQLYLSLACALILAALIVAEVRWRPRDGVLFVVQGVLYCLARFGVEFFREGHAALAGLTTAQWACLAGLVVFGVRARALLRQQESAVETGKLGPWNAPARTAASPYPEPSAPTAAGVPPLGPPA